MPPRAGYQMNSDTMIAHVVWFGFYAASSPAYVTAMAAAVECFRAITEMECQPSAHRRANGKQAIDVLSWSTESSLNHKNFRTGLLDRCSQQLSGYDDWM